MRRFVIAGTFVSESVAQVAYRPLAEALGAEIVALPNLGLGHTADAAEALGDWLWDIGEVDLIGHSQGGLVAALIALRNPAWVRCVVTLASPLAGTGSAHLSVPVSSVRCMAMGARLTADLTGSPSMLNVVASRDCLVWPRSNARLPGADHMTFPVGHLRVATDRRVINYVKEWLDADLSHR